MLTAEDTGTTFTLGGAGIFHRLTFFAVIVAVIFGIVIVFRRIRVVTVIFSVIITLVVFRVIFA